MVLWVYLLRRVPKHLFFYFFSHPTKQASYLVKLASPTMLNLQLFFILLLASYYKFHTSWKLGFLCKASHCYQNIVGNSKKPIAKCTLLRSSPQKQHEIKTTAMTNKIAEDIVTVMNAVTTSKQLGKNESNNRFVIICKWSIIDVLFMMIEVTDIGI